MTIQSGREQTVPNAPVGDEKPSEKVDEVVTKVWNHVRDLVLGRKSVSFMPYAAITLRLVGLTIAVAGLFAPMISSGIAGFSGWLLNVAYNLFAGFGFFVLAELVVTLRKIGDKLALHESEDESDI